MKLAIFWSSLTFLRFEKDIRVWGWRSEEEKEVEKVMEGVG